LGQKAPSSRKPSTRGITGITVFSAPTLNSKSAYKQGLLKANIWVF